MDTQINTQINTQIENDLIPPIDPMCSICFENIEYIDQVINECCKSRFHLECLTRWNGSCPICRSDRKDSETIISVGNSLFTNCCYILWVLFAFACFFILIFFSCRSSCFIKN